MITEDYVSFEVAKLLKEKGFDGVTEKYYLKYKGKYILVSRGTAEHPDSSIDVPTLQMVMKWLREKHNLHIGVLITYQYLPRKYEVHIMHTEKYEDIVVNPGTNFNTNEEACEAAIKYCLKNLIFRYESKRV